MKQKIFNTRIAIAAAWLVTTLPAAMAENAEVSALPYRPTVTNPAGLSEPGWLELELGAQRIKGGENKWRNSYPALAKLAFTDDWGMMVGGEMGVQRTDKDEVVFMGEGDTTFTLKHRIPTAIEGTAWGVEAGYKSPTANDTIGSGKADYILNGIFSTEISGNDLDLNLGATRVGSVTNGVDLNLYSWGASVSRNLNEKWGVFGELSGTTQGGIPSQSQLMAGFTYNFSKRLVFDAGASTGLTEASQEWSAFAGVTTLLGRLW